MNGANLAFESRTLRRMFFCVLFVTRRRDSVLDCEVGRLLEMQMLIRCAMVCYVLRSRIAALVLLSP